MQAAAKQFRGDFFVAIDQPVGKFVRIEAPFLNGDVAVRGDAIAMPAVRNGRKGLVIRLVRLDADSLGIPIQESSKALGIEEDDDDAVQEFDTSQSTVASNVSAAVAKSIRSAGTAAPIKPMGAMPSPAAGVPRPVGKSPSQPTNLEDLDDEAREAVNEFGNQSTKASELSADLAKALAAPPPAATHAVRRVTPEGGVPKQVPLPKSLPAPPPKADEARPGADDDARLDAAFSDDPAEIKDPPAAEAKPPELSPPTTPTPEPPPATDIAKAKPAEDDDRASFGDERTVARPATAADFAARTKKPAVDSEGGFGEERTVARAPTAEELATLRSNPSSVSSKAVKKANLVTKEAPPKLASVVLADQPDEADNPDKPEAKPAAKALANAAATDIVDKLPATMPQKAPNSQLVILIVLMVLAAAAGLALWRGVI